MWQALESNGHSGGLWTFETDVARRRERPVGFLGPNCRSSRIQKSDRFDIATDVKEQANQPIVRNRRCLD